MTADGMKLDILSNAYRIYKFFNGLPHHKLTLKKKPQFIQLKIKNHNSNTGLVNEH